MPLTQIHDISCSSVPVPSGPVFRRRRQTAGDAEEPSNPLQLTGGDLGPSQGLGPSLDTEDNNVNIGEECEEWPVTSSIVVTHPPGTPPSPRAPHCSS